MIFMKSTGKKIKKFKYKRVKIYWQDIVSNPEWMTLNKAKDQVYSWCEDTGYLLFKDSRRVIIFASHSFDDDGELTSKLKEAKKEIQRQKDILKNNLVLFLL